MSPTKPLVTVVVPAYNREHLIAETLDSVLGQDYPHLDVLVLDDGSSDGTPEVLRRYARDWPGRLRWDRHDNMGQARTLNRGFEMARGEFLGTLSSDDLLRPGAIGAVADALIANADAVVAYPDQVLIDNGGEEIGAPRFIPHDAVEAIRLHECTVGVGALFRRSLYDRIGGWDPQFRYCADFDFWIRASLIGPFRHVPKPLGCWRVHDDMTSSGRGERPARERVELIDKLYSRDDLPSALVDVRAEAYRNAYFFAAVLVAAGHNGPRDRFLVADTVSKQVWPGQEQQLEAVLLRQEAHSREQEQQLVRVIEDAQRAHRAAAELHGRLEQLHREVAERDAIIGRFRQERVALDEQLAELRNALDRTSQSRMTSPLPDAARRIARRTVPRALRPAAKSLARGVHVPRGRDE